MVSIKGSYNDIAGSIGFNKICSSLNDNVKLGFQPGKIEDKYKWYYIYIPQAGRAYAVNRATSERVFIESFQLQLNFIGSYFYDHSLLIEFDDRFEILDFRKKTSTILLKEREYEINVRFFDTTIKIVFH